MYHASVSVRSCIQTVSTFYKNKDCIHFCNPLLVSRLFSGLYMIMTEDLFTFSIIHVHEFFSLCKSKVYPKQIRSHSGMGVGYVVVDGTPHSISLIAVSLGGTIFHFWGHHRPKPERHHSAHTFGVPKAQNQLRGDTRLPTISHVSFISPKHISQGFRSSPEMNIRISLCDKRISTVIFFCADAWLGFDSAQDLAALYLNPWEIS